MSDSSNPFAALSGKFPEAKKKGAAAPGVRSTPANSPSMKKRTGKAAEDQDEDTALFLDAMSSIKPLAHARTKTEDDGGMAAAFEAALPPSFEKGTAKGGRSAPAQTAPTGGQVKRELQASQKDSDGSPENGVPAAHAADAGTPDIPESAFTIQTEPGPVEEDLFSKAMQGVAPIAARGRQIAPPSAPPSAPAPSVDPARALRDLLEGRVEFALYHSDEYMEGHVVGVDHAILGRLRAGQLSPEAHLDLHGQNARQALDALTVFIKHAYQRSLRTVTVVTGRGKNSPGGVGVLRPMLQEWLTKDPFKRVVLAFCTALPSDGGPGAVYVLLRKYKKNRGKIIWESAPPDADSAL
jgi:DNA-nicking Smr family endonuclease